MARPRPREAPPRPKPSAASGLARPTPAPSRLARPKNGVALIDWRRDAEVVRLTDNLHTMVQAHARRSTDALVQIGKQLAQIFVRLETGQWQRWLDDNASFGKSSAFNYMKLASWSEREPREFARLRHLGPAKLYVLAGAPRERVRGLVVGKAVDVPGTGAKKTIENMTAPELATVVVDDIATPPVPKEAIAKVVQRLRFRIAALATDADEIIGRADEVDAGDVREIRDELAAVLQRLEDVLDE